MYYNYGLVDGYFVSVVRFARGEIRLRTEESAVWGWDEEQVRKRRFEVERNALLGYDLHLGRAIF